MSRITAAGLLATGAVALLAGLLLQTTVSGSERLGAVLPAGVGVENAAPTKPTSVALSPAQPTTFDALTATVIGSTDPDGDPLTYEYQWVRSTNRGLTWVDSGITGPTLDPSLTTRGEWWRALGRAFDGALYSAWTTSTTRCIYDAVPTAPTSLVTSPTRPKTNDTVTATATGSTDADGDALSCEYEWIRSTDGGMTWALVASGTSLDPSLTAKHDWFRVRARAYDGFLYGPWVTSTLLCIYNTPPTAPTSTDISPSAPDDSDNLTAVPSGSTDADGDHLTYVCDWWVWRVGGRGWDPTGITGLTIGASRTHVGDRWRVRALASDGQSRTDWGPFSAGVTIAADLGGTGAGRPAGGAAMLTGLVALPTRAGAQIALSLSAPADLDARVLNLAGREVRTLCRRRQCQAGTGALVWDTRSEQGLPVPAGTYLIEVTARNSGGVQSRALGTVSVRR